MKTKYFHANNSSSLNNSINLLLKGEIIALPTETVYGLGVCYHSKQALHKLHTIKQRNPSKPIAICLDHYENIKSITQNVPEKYWELGKLFFPGPLTIVFSSGEETLGIRVPEHEVCQKIIKKTGPLYITSANYSTHPPLTHSMEVYDAFKGFISVVLADDINFKYNISSTVIQILESGKVQLLREGPISWDLIKKSL